MSKMGKQLVVDASGQVQVQEFPVPSPTSDQVLVRITTTQMSAGSELNAVRSRLAGRATGATQVGYTAIGRVEAVGSNVTTGVKIGDRVLCGANHCSHWLVTPGLAHAPESIPQQYMLEQAPDDLDDQETAFAVLGDIALHGVRLAQIQLGEAVAVHGLGVIGQLVAQLCRLQGAYPVIGVDLEPARQQLALELGASAVVHAGEEDPVERIRALTPKPLRIRNTLPGLPADAGADVQIHCTSHIGNYPTMLQAAADRGRIILIGAAQGSVEINCHELLRRELTVRGSYETGLMEPHPYWPWSRTRNHHVIWDLIRRGALQVQPLISHTAPYCQAPELYAKMAQGPEGWLSVFYSWE
jgi:threonine dehydrogenase-like Zn-dependent dehydrogenase